MSVKSTKLPDGEVRGACPLDCPDGCAWIVHVDDGRPVALRGNPDHPYTRGALCAKVSRYLEHTRAPDRLLHPLRRTGVKGDGSFERVSWDEALGTIAERLGEDRARFGGESIWPFQGTGTLGYLQGIVGGSGARLWNVLGTSEHVPSICAAAGSEGLRYAIGTDRAMDPEDFAASRIILLWGTNTLTTGHHLWKFISAARQEGAHIVAIDPLRTRTADRADQHIAPLPGTDAALALGLAHVVVHEGGADTAFLECKTVGWPEFSQSLERFHPAAVAAITGLEEELIIDLGRRIARTRPMAVRATMGLQRHAGGGMTLRAITALCAVTGDFALHGGGVAYSTSGYFGGNRTALMRPDLRRLPARKLLMTRLADALDDLDDPPIRSLVIFGANPAVSNPDTARVRRALSRPDLFTVVIEQFATDTTRYADIVLPSTMQTEHVDVHDGYGHLYVAYNAPAAEPAGECLPHTEIFRRLAARMHLEEPALQASDDELLADLLASDDPSLDGITLETLRRDGWAKLNLPRPFIPFADGFPTPSGRFEFASEVAAAGRQPRLIGYTPPAEAARSAAALADGDEQLALIATASHFFMNSMFANHPGLRAKQGPPTVGLHPLDAASRHLDDGQDIEVRNARGSFIARLAVDDRTRPGVAMTTKGFWRALDGGAGSINDTVPERDTDLGGGPVYHDNLVTVEAA